MSGGKSKSSSSYGSRSAGAASAPQMASGNMTVQPFIGNNRGLLAQQLAQGFGPEAAAPILQSPLFQQMIISNPNLGAAPQTVGLAAPVPAAAKSAATSGNRNEPYVSYFESHKQRRGGD